MNTDARLWAIILAGGGGKRMIPLTRAMHGGDLPKQFAALSGPRSLLQTTIDRIAGMVPTDRTLVVVTEELEAATTRQLEDVPGVRLVVQPDDRGTAPGLLLALAQVVRHDRCARVIVLPSDHHVPVPEPLLAAIERAAAASRWDEDEVLTLGAVPDDVDLEYGWIVPGHFLRRSGVRAVIRIDAPSSGVHRMPAGDPLWATSMVVATATALWRRVADSFPVHAAAIERVGAQGASSSRVTVRRLREPYARLAAVDYDAALAATPAVLSVVSFAGAGWCDLDTPRRVLQRMGNTPELRHLLRRGMGAGTAAGQRP
ncbi:MAG TPA: sugar phosphate nucleotidyltransferase [Kofleriaceae bacterium]|nr:sugar phosphate nucleotidyltransferase [Kofleriaceae bacterium]